METIKNIIAEMRKDIPRVVDAKVILNNYADRIEEATAQCNQRKMREALEWCRGFMHDIYDGKEGVSFSADDIERIDAALSTPPRNCDMYASVDDAWNAFCEINPPIYMPSPWLDSLVRFRNWLFEEAKGGK